MYFHLGDKSTPQRPSQGSTPRYQRPRPMELRTGRKGSRSSRSFQRSTFQRPGLLLHLKNSHGVTCVPFTKRSSESASFCVCVCACQFHDVPFNLLLQHIVNLWCVQMRRDVYGVCSVCSSTSTSIIQEYISISSTTCFHKVQKQCILDEVLKLKGFLDSCNFSWAMSNAKNSSETSQNAKCWARNVSPWLFLQNKAGN